MSDIFPIRGVEAALQEAIFDALIEDQPLLGYLGGPRVFDHVPEEVTFPFVSLSQLSVRDGKTATEAGFTCRLTLNVWSRHRGKREAYEVIELLRRALLGSPLPCQKFALVTLLEEFSDVDQDADRLTYRGSMRFRAFLEPLPDAS